MASPSRLALLWRDHRLLLIAFLVAALLAVAFTARTAAFYYYWSTHRDVPIEGWMTVGYVARSYDVDRDILREALGLALDQADRRPLEQIARDRGVPLAQLIAEVMAAIDAARTAGS